MAIAGALAVVVTLQEARKMNFPCSLCACTFVFINSFVIYG